MYNNSMKKTPEVQIPVLEESDANMQPITSDEYSDGSKLYKPEEGIVIQARKDI